MARGCDGTVLRLVMSSKTRYGALPPFMNIQRILEEPLIVNGIKSKTERYDRVKKVMEEVRLSPVEDFIDKVPAHVKWWTTAAGSDCPCDDLGTKIDRC